MIQCIKREGCPVDSRCSGDDWKHTVFHDSEIPFTVYGLLPATKYRVQFTTSSMKQQFDVTTSNTGE